MKTQAKLINHLILNGEKRTAEKNLLKSIKELQKNSNKNFIKILQLALIHSTTVFKLHRIKNVNRKKNKNNQVKEIPGFIKNNKTRASKAIKFILVNIKTKKNSFFLKLNIEILRSSKNKGNSLEIRNELQKTAISNQHFFRYYRWN